MKFTRWALLTAAPLLAAGCGSFSKAMSAHTDVVARAAGHELKVDEAAKLIASAPQAPADPAVIRQLAEMWVDYTLLATAAAEDTSLSVLDMEKLVRPQRDAELVNRLLASTTHVDTVFTDAALQQKWNEVGPGVELHARHILFKWPADATPAQRDSVSKLAAQVRAQAAAPGADFPALARRWSEDTSKDQGGDLGFFGRGRMVKPFEDAAFALQPGQVSPVVESPFGLHVIKLEEKRQQPIGEQKEPFRRWLAQHERQSAVQKYVEALTAANDVKVLPGAGKTAKEIAGQSSLTLKGSAADRPVATYKGGELTAGELAEAISANGAQTRDALAKASDQEVEGAIKQLVTNELLLRDARQHNIQLTPAENDSLRTQARRAIHDVLAATGFAAHRIPKGDAGSAGIEAEVNDLLSGAVEGRRQLVPLGSLGQALRAAYGADVYDGSFARVIEKIKAIRATQPQAAPPAGMPQQGPQGQPMPPMPQQGVPPQGAQPQAR
ncbi:MAG: PpiC-type peptidyl-prolyl cis-trans isomerase [Gemmatimonadetes bacterium]|nr:PpiC-type peptidyl-prolyl cis-trans isomerase [Gemmatimonadota bacterium]